jgi:hypothetical protein
MVSTVLVEQPSSIHNYERAFRFSKYSERNGREVLIVGAQEHSRGDIDIDYDAHPGMLVRALGSRKQIDFFTKKEISIVRWRINYISIRIQDEQGAIRLKAVPLEVEYANFFEWDGFLGNLLSNAINDILTVSLN